MITERNRHLPAFLTGHLLSPPDCDGCPLQGSRIVPPEGCPQAQVALVAETPASEEEEQLRPLVGKSGRLLNHILERIEVPRRELWLSNAILCQPKTIRRRKPDGAHEVLSPDQTMREALVHCAPRLFAELEIVNPKVVIPMGKIALQAILGGGLSIKKRRGAVHVGDLAARHELATRRLETLRRRRVREAQGDYVDAT